MLQVPQANWQALLSGFPCLTDVGASAAVLVISLAHDCVSFVARGNAILCQCAVESNCYLIFEIHLETGAIAVHYQGLDIVCQFRGNCTLSLLQGLPDVICVAGLDVGIVGVA
jgi:hypothetical protein